MKSKWPRVQRSVDADGTITETIDHGISRTIRCTAAGYDAGKPEILPASALPKEPDGLDAAGLMALRHLREAFLIIADAGDAPPDHLLRDAASIQRRILSALDAFSSGRTAVAVGLAFNVGEAWGDLKGRELWERHVQARIAQIESTRQPRPSRRNPAVSWCVSTRKDWLTASPVSLFQAWERFRKLAGKPEVMRKTFETKLAIERRKHSPR